MGRVKYSFFPEKDIQRTHKLCLSNSKAPSNGKRSLLMPYNIDDDTERRPYDMTIMAM